MLWPFLSWLSLDCREADLTQIGLGKLKSRSLASFGEDWDALWRYRTWLSGRPSCWVAVELSNVALRKADPRSFRGFVEGWDALRWPWLWIAERAMLPGRQGGYSGVLEEGGEGIFFDLRVWCLDRVHRRGGG